MSTNAEFAGATATPHHSWGWFLFRGIVGVVFGVLALFFPFAALFAFAAVFAAYALIDGIAVLIIGARGARHRTERSWGLIVSGVIGILVGLIFLIWPILSTIGYAFAALALIAIWAIFTGIFELGTAIRLRRQLKGEWLLGLAGILSILLGIAIPIIAGLAPGASLATVGWLIGVYALIAGISMLILAFRLRGRSH